jgi:hypothetical protein
MSAYCHGRIGDRFIERGDYKMIRAEDNRIIKPSEFSSTVQLGMVMEMCIVVRWGMPPRENEGKCPRCGHVNRHVALQGGWIDWKVPFTSTYAIRY